MKEAMLKDILNDEQIKNVTKIVNNNNNEDILRELKSYFMTIANELLEKDVHHDYLAWCIYANLLNK